MNSISAQGSVPITGGIIYTPAIGSNGAEVNNIKISNTAASAYTIEVYRYMAAAGTRVLLYKELLASGEYVDDDTIYQLNTGDYLYLIPSLVTVVYVITGLEY